MRYPASEKLEIIRIVEQSHLPVKQTVEQDSASHDRRSTDGATFIAGSARPASKTAAPGRSVRPGTAFPMTCVAEIVEMALDRPELSTA